jgi:tetratricopeptide (TPR) repeat protein
MRHGSTVLLLLALACAFPAAAADNDVTKGFELLEAKRYDAALPYFKRELQEKQAKLGPDDPSLAVELNNLAEANRLAGRLDVAEGLYKRAITLDEKGGPKNAAGLATGLNNLALLYRTQGRLAEAEKLHARSLSLLEDALGPNQPEVARSLNNLAALYKQEGKLAQAHDLQVRAVSIAELTLGRKHPDTQQMQRNLAALGSTSAAKGPAEVAARKAAPPPRAPGKAALPPPDEPDPEPEPEMLPALSRGPAPEPKTAAPGNGRFAVQLAAVPASAQVAPEWQRLLKRFPQLRQLELQPPQSVEVAGKGTFYRVIAGPLASKVEAEALCASLSKAGGVCRPAGP